MTASHTPNCSQPLSSSANKQTINLTHNTNVVEVEVEVEVAHLCLCKMNNSTAGKNKSNRPMNDGLKSSLQHASNYQHAILCLCFFILSSSAGAQTAGPLTDERYLYARFSISMAIIIVVLIAALFFMGFFFIYIRNFNESSSSRGTIQGVLSLRSRRAARGLDPVVIESFPTFGYSEIKTLKIGKGALECAVCLNEFEDDETLRLLPKCDHVFHHECIDAWLESHLTCPVCRTNLIPAADESNHFQIPEDSTQPADLNNNGSSNNGTEQDAQRNADVSIRVCEAQPQRPPVVNRNFSFDQNRLPRSRSVHPRLFARFRSNSTGHSLVQAGENLDRFTLRLPEEVREEVMNRARLNRTGSSVGRRTERSSRRGNRTGEGSSRGRSYMRFESLDRLQVKSDRWVFSMAPPFFSRWPSIKSPKVVTANNGDGSSRTPKGVATAVKLPFNCFEPKSRAETGLFAADSSRPPV